MGRSVGGSAVNGCHTAGFPTRQPLPGQSNARSARHCQPICHLNEHHCILLHNLQCVMCYRMFCSHIVQLHSLPRWYFERKIKQTIHLHFITMLAWHLYLTCTRNLIFGLVPLQCIPIAGRQSDCALCPDSWGEALVWLLAVEEKSRRRRRLARLGHAESFKVF